MREAFGGVFMIRLLLVFILIYVIFTSISLNYAKAFKIKNEVISYIEEQEILSLAHVNDATLEGLQEILTKANYSVTCKNGNGPIATEDNHNKYCYNGIIITQGDKVDRIIHYEVATFVYWNLDSLKFLFNLNGSNPDNGEVIKGGWKITGEAKVLKRFENGDE